MFVAFYNEHIKVSTNVNQYNKISLTGLLMSVIYLGQFDIFWTWEGPFTLFCNMCLSFTQYISGTDFDFLTKKY